MKFSIPFTHIMIIPVLTLALFLAGCSNPASSSDEEEHHHPEGVILKMDSTEIVRIEEGVITSGQLEVVNGETTPLITVYFLDHDGELFQPEHDYSLKWNQIDTAVAEINQDSQQTPWSFRLTGNQEGQTMVRFQLWHDKSEHADFETPSIPVTVN
ncbi:hypothetical protein [Fodinibius sediminis]|uniref:Intracellular proteinase inhibitor n=1 Tax=Fodinibius sediminis TaxID=1214077 RepID=A0A521D9C2_9BACT|nr:hypothetical protein [Fodinibius sediminis]SMO68316.1 hypothetical protein SAMN06265218_10943 [Fodinibius sediminis]